ncbi:MAG: hypothetical protein WBC60_00795 [Cognaticolwellia sp.]
MPIKSLRRDLAATEMSQILRNGQNSGKNISQNWQKNAAIEHLQWKKPRVFHFALFCFLIAAN